jgi:ATP-binding cassette subfamily B protein
MGRRPWHYAIGIVVVIVLDGVQMLPALIVKHVTDQAQQDVQRLEIWPWVSGLLLCYLVIALLRIGWRLLLMLPSRSIVRELRQETYEMLLQSDYAQASRLKVGDVVSALTQELTNIRMFMGPGILIFFDTLAYLVFVPATLFYIVGPGAWWVLLPFLGLVVAILVVHRPLEKGHGGIAESLGGLSQYVFEEAQGAKFFRAEGLIELRRRRYDFLLDTLLGRQLGTTKWELGLDGTLQAVVLGSYLMVLGLAAQGQTQAAGQLGALTVSLQLLDKLLWPLMSVSYQMNLFQSAAAGAQRLLAVRNLDPKTDGKRPLATVLTKVSVRGLTVRAPSGETILQNIDLELREGERVALVGPVGSGKTVLLQTLAGLWEPGRLSWREFRFEGVDYRELHREDLWRQLSYVPQTAQVFGKSLAHNISPHMPLQEGRLMAALEAADLAQDVRLFPEGLRTTVGEKGLNLSGGQKQRTLIARSYHSGARLFLWDDAISALDPLTERRVIQNLTRLSPGSILVLATHRLSSLRDFHRIVVMEQGRIVRSGTWDEVAGHPLFQNLLRGEACPTP